jgi:Spy/CpxP family protein refolding chaperone
MNRLMLAFLLFSGAPVLAHEGGSRGGEVAARLGLDEAGAAQLRATFEKYRSQIAPLAENARETRRALREELARPQPDGSRLSQLTDQLTSDRRQLGALFAQRTDELRGQLPPQSYAKLVLREGRHGRFGGRWGRRAGK